MQCAHNLDHRKATAESRQPQIITTADDFGRSTEINRAVIRAHCEGILTSASLMVTGEAVDEAVELARQHPALAVGLHVVLIDGRSVLPHRDIPHLVDERGNFPRDPLRLGLRYLLSSTTRQELVWELRAQFERFAATGLPLSHVDGHWHMHLHPVVLNRLLPFAERYGAHGLRLPRDEFWMAMKHDRRRAGVKALWCLLFSVLIRWCAKRVPRYHLAATARTHGFLQTGHMDEAYVTDILRQIQVPTAELYFHPTTGPRIDPLGANSGDLNSLLSPTLRDIIRERSLQLTTWPGLKQRSGIEVGS